MADDKQKSAATNSLGHWQRKILSYLSAFDRHTLADFMVAINVDRMGSKSRSIYHAASVLRARGYVAVSESEGRSQRLTLTESGRGVVTQRGIDQKEYAKP